MIILQLLINSLIIGSIYALVACGFSLIYTTNKFIHFAHGATIAASAYLCYWLSQVLALHLALGIILTLLFAGLLGIAMHRGLYLPLQQRRSSNVIMLIASVGLLILLENIILLLFGADVKSYSLNSSSLKLAGTAITWLQLGIIGITVVLLIALYLFMKRTTIGKRMRAVADNRELAAIMGINAKRIATYGFALGSILAGIAGILVGIEQNIEPMMGTHLMIKGFTGAIIGGVTSVPASIVGSFLLGFAENFGIWYLPSGYKDAISFGLLFAFLLFKPNGLFGINKGVRK